MTTDAGRANYISFTAMPDDGTVIIDDELETQRLRLTVDEGSEVAPAPTAPFLFPVDNAIAVTTTALSIDPHSSLHVREGNGEHLGGLTSNPREFSNGTYLLEIQGSLKAYVRIPNGRFTASYRSANLDYAPLDVSFETPTRIEIGARSTHSRPQATITVPDEPAALLEALPYLASSIKEFSPERSWPTLRGHPPAIERGDCFRVPDALVKPETGITIEVPPTFGAAYRVAPLAFYLGAEVVEGESPTLHLDNEYAEPLSTPDRTLEAGVEDVLGRCLLLDSLTRIGGYYSLPRYEYDDLAPKLPFYPPNLYDASLSEQLIEYLEVDADVLAPYYPQWPYLPTLRPDPDDAELLPSLLDSLTPVRVDDGGVPTRSASDGRSAVPSPSPATTSERVPSDAVRLLSDAFVNARRRTIAEPTDVELVFVFTNRNRAERFREYVDNARQSRLRAATVDVHAGSNSEALAEALGDDPDLLYHEPSDDSGSIVDVLESVQSATAPPVVAVGMPLDPEQELSLVQGGTVSGLTTSCPPTIAELGRFVSALVLGGSVERSAAFAELSPEHRFFGKPAHVLVRREGGVIPLEMNVRSLALDGHEIVRWAPIVETVPVGSVTRIRNEDPEDIYHLVGTVASQAKDHSTNDVLALLTDDDYALCLNGDPYHGERDATSNLVRESARRTLAERRN